MFELQSNYRDEINSLQIQLSRTRAGPGRAVKEQQEQNSPNHVQRINVISVLLMSAKVTSKIDENSNIFRSPRDNKAGAFLSVKTFLTLFELSNDIQTC